jgi:hypothetical protein
VKLGLEPPRKAKRNKRTEALALRMVGARAAAAQADDLFGKEVSSTQRADGSYEARYERTDGIEVTVAGREGGGVLVELRDSSGAGHTMGLQKADSVPHCPVASGDVPAKLDQTITYGEAVSKHGKRTWTQVTLRSEATWTGHVGVSAKAETFDFALRGEISIRSGVEIAATGKQLKRMPTRTYRSALTKRGLPVSVDPVSFVKEFTLRGPKGDRAGSAADLDAGSRLLTTSVLAVSEIQSALADGDRRWYDERACAKVDFSSSPEKVVRGGRGDWNVWVMAQDGARAADARWSPSSSCGALTASGTTGAQISLSVTDSANAWGPGSSGACAAAEITSTAGRPRPFEHTIFPLEAKRWRYAITVKFRKSMGLGIAETTATGSGTVTTGPGEGLTEGTGEFSGSEWDQTPLNTCGQDMLRTRTFVSAVAIGAEIQGEEVTVAFSAVERPFDAAWILTVPVTGGEQTFTSRQPFCGQPDMAVRTATVTVAATPVG